MEANKKSKITIKDVSRVFFSPSGEKIDALKDVNLEVEDAFSPAGRDIGEFRVLLGPSGCGKSTLLRMIAGLDKPSSGQVLVNGEVITHPGKDRGMVFQKYTSFPWLTVAENVAYGMKINGIPPAQRKETVDHLLKSVGLTEFADVYPETLSGGMQQRVAIARTLALRPSVILMDEPFGALDAQTRSDMQQLLLQIWDETACTILFVTHDVEEAVYLADRIFIMSSHPGTIVEDVHVPFDRPRNLELKEKSEFHDLQHYVLGRLKSSPGIGGHVRVSI
jgi:NitT/TauT family transport system ATP-binding protein